MQVSNTNYHNYRPRFTHILNSLVRIFADIFNTREVLFTPLSAKPEIRKIKKMGNEENLTPEKNERVRLPFGIFISANLLAVIGLLLTNLFWSGNIYVSKILVGEIPPFLLNTVRWLVALIILTPFAFQQTKNHLTAIKHGFVPLLIFSFLGVTVYNSLLYVAAYTTSGINISMVSSLTPVVTFLFVWMVVGIVPRRLQLLGFIFGIAGIMVLITNGQLDRLLHFQVNQGDGYILLAVVSWSIYTALLAKGNLSVPPLVFIYSTIALGFVMTIPIAGWELLQQHSISFSQKNIWALLYIGIFPSLLSFLFYNHAVKQLGANIAAISTYLLPVFTAIISIAWLGEDLQWFHIVGQFLVFTGFILSLIKRREAKIVRFKK